MQHVSQQIFSFLVLSAGVANTPGGEHPRGTGHQFQGMSLSVIQGTRPRQRQRAQVAAIGDDPDEYVTAGPSAAGQEVRLSQRLETISSGGTNDATNLPPHR